MSASGDVSPTILSLRSEAPVLLSGIIFKARPGVFHKISKYLGQLRWGHIYQKIVSPESQPVYLFCASSVKLSNSFDCGDYEQSCFGKRTSGILGPHNDAGNNIGWHTLVLIIGSGLEHQTSPRRGHCTPSFCGGQYQKYCVKPWRRRKRVERSINLRKTHSFHYPKGGG